MKNVFDYAPENTPLYLIDNFNRLYIGTIYKKNNVWYSGECLKGDPDGFYRNKIICWAYLENN